MIKLTSCEKELFATFKKFLSYQKLDLTLRVAGGWVRDKYLGKESSDIDIALDKMMGKEFCSLLHNFLVLHKIPTGGFGVIPINPEQSKHLETATLRVFDFSVDFVNLRSEVYSQDS